MFFQYYVVDFFRTQKEFVEFDDIDPSVQQKLLELIRIKRIKVNPLKLGNSIGVHPLGRYLSVESKLFDFDGSEFIKVFGRGRIQKHSYFSMTVHIMLILNYFQAFCLLSGLSLLDDLIVLVLYVFGAVGHLNHYLLQLPHFDAPYPLNPFRIIFLRFLSTQTLAVEHLIADVPNICLGLLTTLQSFFWCFEALLLKGINKCRKFGASSIVIFMIFFCQSSPCIFFLRFGYSSLFLFDASLQFLTIIFLFQDDANPLLLSQSLLLDLICSDFFLKTGFLLLSTLLILGFLLQLFLLFELVELFFGKFRCGLGGHVISYIQFKLNFYYFRRSFNSQSSKKCIRAG